MQAWASESAEHAAKAAEHAADVAFYEDPTFWVALAFLIFFALAGKKMFGIATAGLDARAETIRTQIEEAQTLRDEAQQLLADNKRRHREAVEEAKEIVAKAREEAERLKDRAAKELEDSLARRRAMAEERIAQAEAKAMADVRDLATEVALRAAEGLLGEKLSAQKSNAMITGAIKELPDKLS